MTQPEGLEPRAAEWRFAENQNPIGGLERKRVEPITNPTPTAAPWVIEAARLEPGVISALLRRAASPGKENNMNNLNQRIYAGLDRSVQFSIDYPLATPIARATALFTELATAKTMMLAQSGAQAIGSTGFHGGVDARQQLLTELLDEMRTISKIARGLDKVAFPTVREEFRMPRSYGVNRVLATARAFVANATGQVALFTERGLPATFVTDLNNRVTAVETAAGGRNSGLLGQVAGTAGIDVAARRGLAALRELDGIMSAALKDNEVLLAAWNVAKHIERRNAAPEPAPAPSPSGS